MKMRDEHTAKINFRRNVDMKIRNLLAALLVISLCICLPVQVSAMGAPVELTVENVSHYAYMDLDVAPAELRGTILEAREQIIFAHSWVAEGEGWIEQPDGTIEVLPQFYDLVPEDWDVPCDPRVADRAVLGGDADIASTSTLFYGSVFFHKPSNTALTDPFRTWTDIRGTMKTTVVSLNQPDSCNVGYTNMRTGKSLAYSSRMKPGATCNYTISSPTIVGARASTYSNEGYGYLRIELST